MQMLSPLRDHNYRGASIYNEILSGIIIDKEQKFVEKDIL
jgi:hypothetical protein